MFDTQHSKREADQTRAMPTQKPGDAKRSIQLTGDLTRIPPYAQAWGNQPPPWLRLPVSQQVTQAKESSPQESPAPMQRKENTTGLPDTLKAGVENLSGLSMDDVRVHYNSSEPAQVQALAYTQGADIHVGPGQEKHLPHEAWHVVQQKQGRVQPTVQAKGVAINDDLGLEKEADVMGGKALQRIPDPALSRLTIVHGTPAIQRKITFSGYADPPKAALIYDKVKSAIKENSELLASIFPKQFDEIFRELNDYTTFRLILPDMVRSPIDYGEINLDNPQHVILFFKDAGKYLMRNYKFQQKSEKSDKDEAEHQERLWEIHKEYSPEEGSLKANTYKTALLGTGASIAYYLAVNGRSLNPKDTVIIGKIQPWDPSKFSPQRRGIDFVNHPMHMISPNRKGTQLPKEASGEGETFEGNPAKLTEDIWQIMKRFPTRVNTTIKKVSRETITKWYKIETDRGIFYADKVVFGLGIGPHTIPENKQAAKITTEKDKAEEKKRVMDLDSFQRQLKDPDSDVLKAYSINTSKFNTSIFIGVAGPNAGADAVYEATKLGMFVDWVVSGGPAVAEGMGNKVTRKGLVDLYFDYLNGWTISGEEVKLNLSGKWDKEPNPGKARDNAEKKFLGNNPGWRVSQEKEVMVDFLVYAQGPDVAKVWNVLDETATQGLELKFDKQGRFGAVVPLSREPSNASITASVKERVQNKVGQIADEESDRITGILLAKAKDILGVHGNFDPIPGQIDVAIGLGAADDSLEIIGGSAIRILNYLDALKQREKVPERLKDEIRGETTSKKMEKVLKTLSSPTILMNDQLTPIRSQIEAQGNYMPGYVGTEESNFVTDDQDMIAAQIASYYANIPHALGDWLTEKIIQDRHVNGVKPGTGDGGRAFVNKWKGKLESLQNLFAAEDINALVRRK
ncbi:MAG: DUF4157 domain-containing protein [Ktedonobacteraceae bacterium]